MTSNRGFQNVRSNLLQKRLVGNRIRQIWKKIDIRNWFGKDVSVFDLSGWSNYGEWWYVWQIVLCHIQWVTIFFVNYSLSRFGEWRLWFVSLPKESFEEAVDKLSQDLVIAGLVSSFLHLQSFEYASCQVVTTLDDFGSTLVCSYLFKGFVDDMSDRFANVVREQEFERLFFSKWLFFVCYNRAVQIFLNCTRCHLDMGGLCCVVWCCDSWSRLNAMTSGQCDVCSWCGTSGCFIMSILFRECYFCCIHS